ncbi:MAG: OmpH family outer membrane protein [Alphaproteobacteria bacterium]|nr:OmpH family outer membrane protein [Alphaproteobacteria bacterium]MDE2111765.1 OmpH family outer membrane protein [Alphaproteobacteria bacterium]MDE2494025.1 OmpH family outer membrane protein [Alphaproteobacteria bacterium]
MTKKLHVVRTMMVAGMLSFAMAGLDSAVAAPPPPTQGAAPTARILLVDLRRVMGGSKVGQDIQKQVAALKADATKQLNGEGLELQKEKTQLEQQAAILAPDVKARRIKDFDSKAQAFQKKLQERGALIQGGVMKAQQQIEQALGPILQGIMQERGATILLDRSAVLLAPNAIDVTDVAIQRLDMRMPAVKVELTAPPAGAQPPPQQQ